jgi:hypothetical protein
MKLIPDWRQAWKFLSVQAFAIIIALPMIWATLPADVKGYLPDDWKPWIMMALAVAGILGRIIDQNKAPAA